VDERFFEDGFLVHFFDEGTDFVVGELADVVAEKDLVFGEGGEGVGTGDWRVSGILVLMAEEVAELVILAESGKSLTRGHGGSRGKTSNYWLRRA